MNLTARFAHVAAALLIAAAVGVPACPTQADTTTTDCTTRAGDAQLLIRSVVLARDGVLPRGEVLVRDGKLACVGTDCTARAGGATVLTCPTYVLSPGMINDHDHISFTGIAPRPDSGERFEHRNQWRFGLQGHTKTQDFGPDTDARVIAWGELRMLAGGTTSIVGGAMAPGLVRNLDFPAGLEALPVRVATYKIFPLDDLPGQMRTRDCDYGAHPSTAADVAQTNAFLAHVAEGDNEAARNEFRCESSTTYDTTPMPGGGGTSNDWIAPNATLIHGVGLTKANLALVARRGASIVWSPRSNFALYGQTLDILEAHKLGINLALGSDWLPSGSMNQNRELNCAALYDHAALHDALTDEDLWKMVTIGAARAAHVDTVIGSIAPGMIADLALFAPRGTNAFAAVVQSTPQSTALVIRGGSVLYGDGTIVDALHPVCESVTVGGSMKRLCAEPGRPSAAELETFAYGRNLYPLAFDDLPRNEPPCTWNAVR